ncbi:hypothetical protein [Shewanella colwelliana]|uniref:hypothetical protein n=1 Tax=Shewanella colwelliana TaxID=23 RepID=UPI003735D6AF
MEHFIIAPQEKDSPFLTLHMACCPHAPLAGVISIGVFAGCFTAMVKAETAHDNVAPCVYCCGALVSVTPTKCSRNCF